MKPQELRIGNYVYFLGKEVKVLGMHYLEKRPDMIWIQTKKFIPTKIIQFKPIPLTEEWLLKLGFEYHDQDEAYYNDALHVEDRNVDRYLTKELREELKDSFGIWHKGRSGLLRDIKFVHELQNLYFALTGTELKQNA